MLGNVWRFDLTSNNPVNWVARTDPVIKVDQPITSAIAVSSSTKNEIYRVMLSFGTGRLFPKTLDKIAGSATGDHYLYGIWDADMESWNSKKALFATSR